MAAGLWVRRLSALALTANRPLLRAKAWKPNTLFHPKPAYSLNYKLVVARMASEVKGLSNALVEDDAAGSSTCKEELLTDLMQQGRTDAPLEGQGEGAEGMEQGAKGMEQGAEREEMPGGEGKRISGGEGKDMPGGSGVEGGQGGIEGDASEPEGGRSQSGGQSQSDVDDKYQYLQRGFTSEIFKIEIQNIPKYIGYTVRGTHTHLYIVQTCTHTCTCAY